jgi:hypothetical protein
LTGTLSSLGGLGVITLELIGLALNMFYTSILLGHSPCLFLALEHIINGYQTCTLIGLTICVLVFVTSSINLTMVVELN